MIKALFFDLDGTLLTSEGRIAQKTLEALKTCKENGIYIYPNTGRPPLLKYMLSFSDDEWKIISEGGIFYNGGCICRREIKEYSTIDPEVVDIALAFAMTLKDVNVAFQMKDEKHSFRFELSEDVIPYWGINKKHISPFKDFDKMSVVKIYFFSNEWNIFMDGYFTELKKLFEGKATFYLTSGNKSMEIVARNVSKKSGIDKLMKYLGLEESEIAVFGDDGNDFEMIKGFKNSVAMGNATDEIKSVAGFVTKNNNDEGIFHALKHHFKIL